VEAESKEVKNKITKLLTPISKEQAMKVKTNVKAGGKPRGLPMN